MTLSDLQRIKLLTTVLVIHLFCAAIMQMYLRSLSFSLSE